jgi:hypothetical protein
MEPIKGKAPLEFPLRWTVKGLERYIEKNWCLASYLIVNINIGELVELVDRELPADFARRMAGLVHEYLYEGKMPPPEIAQTVLNVSEDMASGRPVQLRAGDYIAAQKFFRS